MTSGGDELKEEIERLSELSRKDPERFEMLRRELIERTIQGFPERFRPRAYGIQFQLDAALRHYKDPVARMNKMVEIFWEQFQRFQEAVCMPERVARERAAGRMPAKVIPLHNFRKTRRTGEMNSSDHPLS